MIAVSNDTKNEPAGKAVEMNRVVYDNEHYYKISNCDAMRPFFMNIVSDSNHWMFISSNGGLTAGRKNPGYALFPYYTDDKIAEFADITGSKSIFQIQAGDDILIWEPFSERFLFRYDISRNLYKSIYGNKIIFEEINHDLGLTFRYQWNSGKAFGFIRKAELLNTSDTDYHITLLDGIQNIMPYGVPNDLQSSTSNLVDAYKRSELEPASGIGIYALSAIIVDKAEPSEALKANIAWSLGLEQPTYLLSSLQLNDFRKKQAIREEHDVKGEKGAYFVCKTISLPRHSGKNWYIIANVNQTHAQIISLCQIIKENAGVEKQLQDDIASGTKELIRLVAGADGLQCTADKQNDTRHFSNVLFNIMRGGTFDDNYRIEKEDFVRYLSNANKEVAARSQGFIGGLETVFSLPALRALLLKSEDADLIRLGTEYLPLKFSRRHGDPSRPWNYFSINTQSETDGSKILDYEGNWRDLFQNWEALVHSYPEFIEGMIFKFLNASTFDGYNPYRVTKGGFDWETIEPDNPWSYIGYWGDHQVIYLLKFLEFAESRQPGALESLFDKEYFVYANVPYRIKPYEDILKDPKNTIEFDEASNHRIAEKIAATGADGALSGSGVSEIHHVNFVEKLLAMTLAKISNFIPEAGIWMNTQRPEWNDANNALVGNGVSMVTLYYLRRFFVLLDKILTRAPIKQVLVSDELAALFQKIHNTLEANQHLLEAKGINDAQRKTITDALGQAASDYRNAVYDKGFSGKKSALLLSRVAAFSDITLQYLEHTIRANERPDHLYHAYNLMTVQENGISTAHLSEMLEGQVAVISAGYLNAEATLKLLDALRNSALYRSDQQSYLLYPNKDLPRFLEKNNIPEAFIKKSALLCQLLQDNNLQIINRDVTGGYHFNGNFKNAGDVKAALKALQSTAYASLAESDADTVLQVFEDVFNHKAFTGRSGTFFSYEGLGSIYWHMVSKLHLAVQEACLKAIEEEADADTVNRLIAHFYEIGRGIGVHKSPELYGAFPTDPYSHTPQHRGAQQPGMTGQVKEDILVHWGELGVFAKEGQLYFNPGLLREEEFLKEAQIFEYHTVNDETRSIPLNEGQLAFTYCLVPIIYSFSDADHITVCYAGGSTEKIAGKTLNRHISSLIFRRTGEIERIEVSFNKKR